MAIIAGASAVLIKGFSYTLSLVFLPLVLLSFTLFTAYLAQAEIVSEAEGRKKQAQKKLTVVLVTLTYKRRLLEVILDFFVIAFAYYLAFALRFEFSLSDSLMNLYLTSLPIAVASTYLGSFSFRSLSRPMALYRSGRSCAHRQGGGCRHGSVDGGVDFFQSLRRLIRASLLSRMGCSYFSAWQAAGSLFACLVSPSRGPARRKCGCWSTARATAERWSSANAARTPTWNTSPSASWTMIHAKRDAPWQACAFLAVRRSCWKSSKRKKVEGCIISSSKILANGHAEQIRTVCQEQGLWIKQLRLEFVEEER